jgi:electron transport complex protein RnfG
MSTGAQDIKAAAGNPRQMITLMTVVSLVCGILIVSVYQGTLEPIRRNVASIMSGSVAELLTGTTKQVIYGVLPDGQLTVLDAPDGPLPKVFAAFDADGRLLGLVIEASERGYGDVIKALFAYDPESQRATGFKVVDMKETPGLGDKIANDPDFLKNFSGLDLTLDAEAENLAHPVITVKNGKKSNPWEIDGISGATISSRAVGRMINKSANAVVPAIARNLDRIKRGD